MEATALSVGKSVLDGAIGYAKSAFAEEVALQLGVRRDQVFITNELEMMKAFLESAHGEGADDKVVKVWVKQVRDMAYDVEDCLQEFAVRLNKQSWWRIRHKMLDRRRVAKQMKELRANVEDVSQRNTRYSLIKGSGSKAATYTAAEQSSITSAALFSIDEARRAAKQEKSQVDLVQMINEEENNLRVIAVWGTSGGLGQTSIVRKAYENPDIESKFSCRAWVRLMHPFDPKDFVQSMVEQFNAAGGVNVLLRKKKTVQELTNKFEQYVNEKRYLIVINDLSTIEEWDRVKKCFPNNNMGSRIIVSTTQVEVASLCAGQGSVASELKQFSAGQNIYAFHDKGSQDATDLINEGSSSNTASTSTANKSTVPTCEISEENTVKKSLTRIRTMVAALEESHLVGREKEKSEIIKLVTGQATGQFEVITVWGMGGLGKTTLVKDIYQSQELSGIFDNRACVTVMRPFNLEELLRSLFMQLDRESSEKKDVVGLMSSTKNTLLLMSLAELIKELAKLFQTKRCLIVLDDVLSTAEWDRIEPIFHEMRKTIRIIVTTREESIAKHCCSQKQENIYKLKDLEYKDAHDLFTKKVFKGTVDLDKQYPELVQPAKLILKKCDQLPLAIVTIACFLATQPKTPLEWRKLSEHLSAELEMNPQLGTIRTVLMRSYDGLPYHLKSCFLYMPIFPEDHRVGRGRLARRWSAEGYCREVRGKSAEEMADSYFMELIARSMVLPPQESIRCTKGIDSCQVHDLMREIGISKSMEENLVFTLEQGCSTNSQVTMRHLAISSNWEGDQNEFESMVDVSRVRSLTVFGKWKSFFISDRMRLLRVLDLEDATGLLDHHLKHIGKFLHLRYLSLRGCGGIFHLPDLLGNLRQLETLDIRGTNVVMLPKTIIKLLKLKSLRAGEVLLDEDVSYEEIVDDFPKVFGKTANLDEQGPELLEQANLILKKCNVLPLAIVATGGFLANQPKSALKWKILNDNISAELEMNPELEIIRTVLMKSYDGLPYYLKSCFLYLSIFPEDHKINLKWLLQRWIAEGYSSVVRNKAAEEIAESYLMELISRSMLLPIQKSSYRRKGIDSCQVHDIIREIGISKSTEEHLVFRLEEGCSLLNTKGIAARHLAINGNWEGDESEFESMVDMSRVRSLTVFGEWKSFFLSEKMSLLRVLDLEDATGLVDHHLKHIGKLLHLRYLSLRGCQDIRHLPDSLGNLRELKTLDIRDTRKVMLPKTIIKLQKLKSLRALVVHPSFRAVRTMFCCYALQRDSCGVLVPRGMKKLKALQTLGVVNIRQRGNVSLQEIKGLTQLRKLGMTGINKNNSQERCAAIVGLSRLESLSIRSEGMPGLCGCLDGTFSFPENLQSLKLYGNLVKLPEWVQGLKNMAKLKLRSAMISEPDAAIQVLGSLPNLAFLHLLELSFKGEEVSLNFPPEMFPSLIVLELELPGVVLKAVKFEQGATRKLELLKFGYVGIGSDTLSGLALSQASRKLCSNVPVGWNT